MMYSEDLFKDFLDNRAEMFGKKINTSRAVKAQRAKLEEWAKIGYNTDAIIQHAIEVGWRGLYLPQGMTPKQTHLKAPRGPLFDQVQSVVEKTKPPVADPNKGRAAIVALNQILREAGQI